MDTNHDNWRRLWESRRSESTSGRDPSSSSSAHRSPHLIIAPGFDFNNAHHARAAGLQEHPCCGHPRRRIETHLDDPFGGKIRNRVFYKLLKFQRVPTAGSPWPSRALKRCRDSDGTPRDLWKIIVEVDSDINLTIPPVKACGTQFRTTPRNLSQFQRLDLRQRLAHCNKF